MISKNVLNEKDNLYLNELSPNCVTPPNALPISHKQLGDMMYVSLVSPAIHRSLWCPLDGILLIHETLQDDDVNQKMSPEMALCGSNYPAKKTGKIPLSLNDLFAFSEYNIKVFRLTR